MAKKIKTLIIVIPYIYDWMRRSHTLLIFFVLVYSIEGYVSCIPKNDKNRWFYGETSQGGYSNQLTAILSYVPLALFLNASLIVGPMYSRSSFEHTFKKVLQSSFPIPFSDFYDWKHFHDFWQLKNLNVIESKSLEDCMKEISFNKIHRKSFFAKTDIELLQMLNSSGISVPIPSNIIFLNIDYVYKSVALYNHWQSNNHLKLLYDINLSLKPNTILENIINYIIKFMSSHYIAAHIRIEGDIITFDGHKDIHFQNQISKHINYLNNSDCLQQFNRNITKSTPLFVASGVFQSLNSSFLYSRGNQLTEKLKNIGFENIYNRDMLLADYFKPTESAINTHTHDTFRQQQQLSVEQYAYIDQEISRRSFCFVPAYHPSSFSYVVLRQRQQMSKKGPLEMDDMKRLHYGNSYIKFGS